MKALQLSLSTLAFVVLIAACEGGVSVDISGPKIGFAPEISEPVTSIGVAVTNSDIRVNGVRYSTRSATIRLNGTIVGTASILPGHYVHITGRVHGLGLDGTAEYVDIDSSIVGPLESVDVVENQLTVLGQTVMIGASTSLGAGIDPGNFDGLPVGVVLRVSGYAMANGHLAATRIDLVAGTTIEQVIGKVTVLNTATMRFRIGGLEVDYSAARYIALPQGAPSPGDYVLVRGNLVGDTLRADELAGVRGSAGRDVRERTYLEGVVTDTVDTSRFDVGAFRIAMRASTKFENGARTDLDVGAQVRIYGRVGTDGATIDADEIEYRPLLDRQPGPLSPSHSA